MPKVMTSIATAQVLVALAAMPLDAQAQRRGRGNHPPAPSPSMPQPGTAIASINAYVDKFSEIDLMQAMKLKPKLKQGKQLEQLIVEASANANNAKLILKVNGVKVSQAPVGYLSQKVVMSVPAGISPQDSLSISASKSTYISTTQAVLSGHVIGGPQVQDVLKAQVEQHVVGEQTFPLKALIKQQTGVALRGMKIKKVILKAKSTSFFNARAQLIINGYSVGFSERIEDQMGKIVLEPSKWDANVVGSDIQTIKVKITGNAYVKMVGVKVDGHLQGPGPVYGNQMTVRVNRTFYTSQRVSLEELVAHAPQIQAISQVKVKVSGKGKIMVTGHAGVIGSINVDSYFSQIESLHLGYGTQLKDVKMRVIGNVSIEEVTLKK